MNVLAETITKSDILALQSPGSIDEVIIQLENIIAYCQINNNCAGYFPVLYHTVTCKVRDCINNKSFLDGARMEKLDVAFASRYLSAFHSWIAGEPMTASWKTAFDSVSDNSMLVVQHFLLGMNAHINLDLGISTAFVMQGFLLDDIHKDFDTINSILSSMIDNIESCLAKVNPLMKLLNLDIYKYDEMLVQFSMTTARDGAWSFANELFGKSGSAYQDCITSRDTRIAQLAASIAKPRGFLLKFMVKIIRLFEKKNVPDVINFLGE